MQRKCSYRIAKQTCSPYRWTLLIAFNGARLLSAVSMSLQTFVNLYLSFSFQGFRRILLISINKMISNVTPKIFPVILMNLRYCLAPIWYSASTCRKYGRKKNVVFAVMLHRCICSAAVKVALRKAFSSPEPTTNACNSRTNAAIIRNANSRAPWLWLQQHSPQQMKRFFTHLNNTRRKFVFFSSNGKNWLLL